MPWAAIVTPQDTTDETSTLPIIEYANITKRMWSLRLNMIPTTPTKTSWRCEVMAMKASNANPMAKVTPWMLCFTATAPTMPTSMPTMRLMTL